jgi:hypothetical protein
MSKKKVSVKKAVQSLAKKVVGKKSVPKKKPVAKKALGKKTAKTVVKKTAAKTKVKSKPKKSPAMKKPSKDLLYASDQESFWTQNGEILNSLIALRDALPEMSNDVYQFHATGTQNDFSVWVETVLCDGDCAADLGKAKTSKSAKTVVVKHLKLYVI